MRENIRKQWGAERYSEAAILEGHQRTDNVGEVTPVQGQQTGISHWNLTGTGQRRVQHRRQSPGQQDWVPASTLCVLGIE